MKLNNDQYFFINFKYDKYFFLKLLLKNFHYSYNIEHIVYNFKQEFFHLSLFLRKDISILFIKISEFRITNSFYIILISENSIIFEC